MGCGCLNTLISGYSLNWLHYEALNVFFDKWMKGVAPNVNTLVYGLSDVFKNNLW